MGKRPIRLVYPISQIQPIQNPSYTCRSSKVRCTVKLIPETDLQSRWDCHSPVFHRWGRGTTYAHFSRLPPEAIKFDDPNKTYHIQLQLQLQLHLYLTFVIVLISCYFLFISCLFSILFRWSLWGTLPIHKVTSNFHWYAGTCVSSGLPLLDARTVAVGLQVHCIEWGAKMTQVPGIRHPSAVSMGFPLRILDASKTCHSQPHRLSLHQWQFKGRTYLISFQPTWIAELMIWNISMGYVRGLINYWKTFIYALHHCYIDCSSSISNSQPPLLAIYILGNKQHISRGRT